MSRAVPSPPTKTIKSALACARRFTAVLVSCAVVSFWVFMGKSSKGNPVLTASSCPIILGQVSSCIGSFVMFLFRHWRNSVALSGATGSAPLAIASFMMLSVPFRPTFPPMPAIGLTMKPIINCLQQRFAC